MLTDLNWRDVSGRHVLSMNALLSSKDYVFSTCYLQQIQIFQRFSAIRFFGEVWKFLEFASGALRPQVEYSLGVSVPIISWLKLLTVQILAVTRDSKYTYANVAFEKSDMICQ